MDLPNPIMVKNYVKIGDQQFWCTGGPSIQCETRQQSIVLPTSREVKPTIWEKLKAWLSFKPTPKSKTVPLLYNTLSCDVPVRRTTTITVGFSYGSDGCRWAMEQVDRMRDAMRTTSFSACKFDMIIGSAEEDRSMDWANFVGCWIKEYQAACPKDGMTPTIEFTVVSDHYSSIENANEV